MSEKEEINNVIELFKEKVRENPAKKHSLSIEELFKQAMARNEAHHKREQGERSKANKSVLRSYRIKMESRKD
jgi:hypothetical protein